MPKVPDNPQFRGIQTGSRNATNAAGQIGSALEGLGGTLLSASEEIDRRLLLLQKGKDDARLLDYEGEIAEQEANFAEWKRQNQDKTDEWAAQYKSTVGATMDRITTEDGSPEFRRRRAMMVKARQIAGLDRTRAEAGMLDTQNVKQAFINAANRYEREGRHDMAQEVLRQGEPYLGKALVSKETQRLEFSGIVYNVENVPDEELNNTIDTLKEGGGPIKNEYERREALSRLEKRRNSLVSDQVEQIRQWQALQPGTVTEGQIRDQLAATELTLQEQEIAAKSMMSDEPMNSADRGALTSKIQKLREYWNDPNRLDGEYDHRRAALEAEMSFLDAGHRAPDLWNELGYTAPARMQRVSEEMWEKRESANAQERKEFNSYLSNHVAKPKLLSRIGYKGSEARDNLLERLEMPEAEMDAKVSKFTADFEKWIETTELPKGKDRATREIQNFTDDWYATEFEGIIIEDMDLGLFGSPDPSLPPVRPSDYGRVSQDAGGDNAPLPLEGVIPAMGGVLPPKGSPITKLPPRK